MSQIAIFIDVLPKADVLIELQEVLGHSVAEIRTQIDRHLPIVLFELFDSTYDEKSALLRALIGLLDKFNLASRIYELPEETPQSQITAIEKYRRTTGVLTNILNEADGELDRQFAEMELQGQAHRAGRSQKTKPKDLPATPLAQIEELFSEDSDIIEAGRPASDELINKAEKYLAVQFPNE